jgi:hypothetical protein
MQDKNAAPLNELDVLMEETYEHIIELADQVESSNWAALVGSAQPARLSGLRPTAD